MYSLLRSSMRRFLDRHGKRLRDKVNRYIARYSVLGNPQIFDAATFSWTRELEDNWEAIRDEMERLLPNKDEIPPLADISPDHVELDEARKWRTFFLWGYGYRVDENCAKAPRTAEMVERIPNVLSALFSIHEPGAHLPRHTGPTKGMITCHLALKIPPDREKCRIEVEDKTYNWTPGRFFIFDDTYNHEVWNDTDELRVILLIHVRRPLAAPGRWVQNAIFWAIRHSPFVQDVKDNLRILQGHA